MNQRNVMVWALIAMLLLVAFNMFYQQPVRTNELTYSEFLDKVKQQQVGEVLIQGQKLTGKLTDGTSFSSYAPDDPSLVESLLRQSVTVKAGAPDDSPWYIIFLTSWAPMILLILFWVFFMRQMQGGGGKTMSFGRSRARMITQESARVTFDNVAGVDEAKEELSEVVDFLSNPKKFTRLGGRIPKGVLLVGPPGTGKTLLAKAVAGEAGVPFFSISGSDFVEMFVGVGASRVRDLFAQGKKNAPCLIFIDEIDAVGRQRGAGLGGGHDEREQTLNQLLVEMDGFEANEGVILIAATNRPDVLDPALQRPGRFDRQVVVPPPDIRGRKQILQVHSKRTPLANDVDLETLAKGTPGFSGADLENLVNEAALMAAKDNKDFLNMSDFENAKDKLLMGKERRTMVQTPEDLKNTAYHEAGHAILNLLLPETDTLHKVTIIPRGRALGVTMYLPEEDKHTLSRVELESKIRMAFGGRAAELIIFDKYTTGASDDIQKATKLARAMVCKWGMSESIGPMAIGEQSQEVFIGREWVANKDHSEETSRLVDAEVKRIIDTAMSEADRLLRENIDCLHRVAEALLERETITGEETRLLMEGKTLPPLDLKSNPRKLMTTDDYEKQGKSGKREVSPDTDARGGNVDAKIGDDAEDADAAPDFAPGYDPYGEPGPEEDKKEERRGQEAGTGLKGGERSAKSESGADGRPAKKKSSQSPLGAHMIDLGAESTRPGAEDIGPEKEWRRLEPALAQLLRFRRSLPLAPAPEAPPFAVSIDTFRAATARKALEADSELAVDIINDISGGLFDPEMDAALAAFKPGFVLCHSPYRPQVMQDDPRYENVVDDILGFFESRLNALNRAGLPEECVALDPGIGFGKTLEHTRAICAAVPRFAALGRPLYCGVSRKSFLGLVSGLPLERRHAPTIAATALLGAAGVEAHRVHEVEEAVAALKMAAFFAVG